MAFRTLTEVLKTRTPPWLHGPWGQRWTTALGSKFQLLVAHVTDGVKSRFVGIAPADSLQYHGEERNIGRAPTSESDESYRARLLDAWDIWQYAGTKWAIYLAFGTLGWQSAALLSDGTEPILPGSSLVYIQNAGAIGTWNPRFWTWFLVILDWYAHNGGSPPAIPAETIAMWTHQIRTWKSAHSTCRYIVAITSAGGYSILCGFPICGAVTCGGTADIIPVGET